MAAAATGALFSLAAPPPAVAAIVVTASGAGAGISGSAANDSGANDRYSQGAPPGGLDLAGEAAVVGARATSRTTNSSDVIFDAATDVLEARGDMTLRLTATMSGPANDPTAVSTAGGGTSFGLGFTLSDRSYFFELAADASAAASHPDTPGNRAFGEVLLVDNTRNQTRREVLDQVGFGRSTRGATSGVLAPGDYRFSATTSGSIGLGTADLGATFRLLVTPVSRWENPAGGSFQTAGNWTGDVIPGANDVALFDLPGTYAARLDADVTNRELRVSGDGVNLTLDLGGNTYTVDRLVIGAAAGDNVSLTLTGGGGGPVGISSADATRAAPPAGGADGGAFRTLSLAGVPEGSRYFVTDGVALSGPEFAVAGDLVVKDVGTVAEIETLDVRLGNETGAGIGRVLVSDGGTLLTGRATVGRVGREPGPGRVVVTGAESLWRALPADEEKFPSRGTQINGTVIVQQGGAFQAAGVAIGFGRPGLLSVEDAGSLFTADDVRVGGTADGELRIAGGATAEVRRLDVGALLGLEGEAFVQVAGRDSDLVALDGIRVTADAPAAVLVNQGASVSAVGDSVVGRNGSVRVQGGDVDRRSSFEAQRLTINSGGSLELASGGFARVAETATVGGGDPAAGRRSTASVDNALLRVVDTLRILDQGTVSVLNNGELSVGNVIDVAEGGLLRMQDDGRVNVGQGEAVFGAFRVGPGGVISGEGSIQASNFVEAGGSNLLPGNSPGTLTLIGNFTQEDGALLSIELAGTGVQQFDIFRVTGNATIGGNLLLEFIDGFAPRAGDRFEFLDVGGTLVGDFDIVEIRNLAPGFEFDLARDGGGMALVARSDGVFVPEPGAAGMILIACAGLLRRRRRAVL